MSNTSTEGSEIKNKPRWLLLWEQLEKEADKQKHKKEAKDT